jgi:hypothetical protein
LYQAVLSLDNPAGEALLIAYIVGGILLAAAAILPGNSVGWRIFSVVVGLGMAAWAGYVFLFGGWIIFSIKILILPVVLVVRAIVAAVKGRSGTATGPVPGQQFSTAPQPGYGYPTAPSSPGPAGVGQAQWPGQPHPAWPQAQPGQPGQPYGGQGYPQPGQPQPGYPQPGQPAGAPGYGAFAPRAIPQQPQGHPQQSFQQPPTYQQPPTQQPGQQQPPTYGPPAQPVPDGFRAPAPFSPPTQQYRPAAPQGPAAFNSVRPEPPINY